MDMQVSAKAKTLAIPRYFSSEDIHPFDAVTWDVRDAVITDAKGNVIFEQRGVEFPSSFSQMAVNVVSSKYFSGPLDSPNRERSFRQLVGRVVGTITQAGIEHGYFDEENAKVFGEELMALAVGQYLAWNSPVWFNAGVIKDFQASACLPYDVRISTNMGLLMIGDIVSAFHRGEDIKVYDRMGKLCCIQKAICNGKRWVWDVELADGSKLPLTYDHTVFVHDNGVEIEKQVKDIKVGNDFLILSRDATCGIENTKIGTLNINNDIAWVSGLMVGNGYSGKPESASSPIWEIKVNTIDEKDRICSIMDYYDVSYSFIEFHWGFTVRGYGINGREFWKRLDLWNHTNDKIVPDWVFYSNADVIGSFLQGLFDTDGSVVPHSDGIHVHILFSNTSEQVARSAHLLLRSLGIFSTFSSYLDPRTDSNRKECYSIAINDRVSVDLFSKRVGLTNSNKKSRLDLGNLIDGANKLSHSKVVSISRRNPELVYDLQTDCSTFWANGVLVHNCFINHVDDTMESILDLAKVEGMEFKSGSGAGVNLSAIRGSMEGLGKGGIASGPVSFMRGFDAFAGVIKSGGRVRRAAKINILNSDHPDIEDFIECKVREEHKAQDLIAAGYSNDFSVLDPNSAYNSVYFQNANHSVRMVGSFMSDYAENREYALTARTDGRTLKMVKARDILSKIAKAAWETGDPAVQFDDVANEWNPVLDTKRINASNPCCFTGETLIDTSEGKIRIDDLKMMFDRGDELPFVFSYDKDTNLPVLRKIKRAWLSGHTKDLVEVTTDKGINARCTPSHVFLLRSGKEMPAYRLKKGDRLRKIGRFINTRRSNRRYINHRETSEIPNGTINQARFMWLQAYGSIPAGVDVHHINEDTTDDRLSNFKLVLGGEHQSGHSLGSKNARFIEVSDAVLREVWEEVEATIRSRTYKKKVTVSRWNSYIRENNLAGKIPLANIEDIRGISWDEFTQKMEQVSDLVNDKVCSVKPITLQDPVAVYDLEIEGTHNFAITSRDIVHSIIVHNSEYFFIDDSACNLASLNLIKFKNDTAFDIKGFKVAVRLMIISQDILVSAASYPTEAIMQNSLDYRPLGAGYTNLGGLLMVSGIPYDSDQGRELAAGISAILTGTAYLTSIEMAIVLSPFTYWEDNKSSFMRVLRKHLDAATKYAKSDIWDEALSIWGRVILLAEDHGVRNAQVSVCAPTGTISFIMDSDTTGIEPELSLVRYKTLVGGGHIKMANKLIVRALTELGYSSNDIGTIVTHIANSGTAVGSTGLKEEHLKVFDCSLDSGNGRVIDYMAHVTMMAAIQPFISGAISKTVNVPSFITPKDIENIYCQSWMMGLKSVAIYRDGSKSSQPMNAKKSAKVQQDNDALIHSFSIGGYEGYMVVSLSDGRPSALFLTVSREGSIIAGLTDAFATAISIGLQHGVPLEVFYNQFNGYKFQPCGATTNPEIPVATSICDYVLNWLSCKFMKNHVNGKVSASLPLLNSTVGNGPPCQQCWTPTQKSGACWRCPNCGSESGCDSI